MRSVTQVIQDGAEYVDVRQKLLPQKVTLVYHRNPKIMNANTEYAIFDHMISIYIILDIAAIAIVFQCSTIKSAVLKMAVSSIIVLY